MTVVGRLHVLVDSVALARVVLQAGAPVVQVRVKGATDRALHDVAGPIAAACAAASATCLVDDRADVAVAVGADGVHVGAEDLPVESVRRVVGPDRLVGGTAREPALAVELAAAGADYLGVGPCFATTSKVGLPDPGGSERVRRVAAAVDVPVIAIAGVTVATVAELLDAGAYGVAVIGAVRDAPDPARAVTELLTALDRAG